MRYSSSKYGFKQCLRFRKWSRKAYAVLLSMRYQVSIGHVNKWIADSALNKNVSKGNNSIFANNEYANNYLCDDSYEDTLSDNIGLNVFSQNLTPIVIVPDYNSANLYYYIYNTDRETASQRFMLLADGLFLFLIV